MNRSHFASSIPRDYGTLSGAPPQHGRDALSSTFLSDLSVSRASAIEAIATRREQERIGQQLHDDLGGVLTGLKACLSVVIDRGARAPDLRPERGSSMPFASPIPEPSCPSSETPC